MTDMFLELCARECAAHVQRMFDHAPRIPGTGMAERPIVGGKFLLGLPLFPELVQEVCAALRAAEQFERDEPAWPPLPLHKDAIAEMKDDDDPRIALEGLYADLLAGVEWNYALHPRIARFASGLMAYPHTPIEILANDALRQEFPPRPLDGICDEWLTWRSPETIAFTRDMTVRGLISEARMAQERGGI